jgi:5-(carboxyamino)imidazole ribonucleotide mutase
MLEQLSIPYELTIASAHRTPERVRSWVKSVQDRGGKAIIAGAGGAAHLPGVVASETILPVIGVPMPTLYFGGQDSLLSIVQMPAGIPVATMAVGKAGAKNAALFAAQMLATHMSEIVEHMRNYRESMRKSIERKNEQLAQHGIAKYLDGM